VLVVTMDEDERTEVLMRKLEVEALELEFPGLGPDHQTAGRQRLWVFHIRQQGSMFLEHSKVEVRTNFGEEFPVNHTSFV
jgi:hypothetical protein